MISLDQHPSGRHFLQIPGPSPVPDRILRAISLPTIDHRGPEFGVLGKKVVTGMQQVFQTKHPVAIYPASGTGAWEAALANTMSPGDSVLMYETGHFASQLPRAYWGWDEIVEMSPSGYWPYTPNTNLLYGLSEALDMILDQGLPAIFARHKRWSEGVRAAVRAWGLPTQCADAALHSPVLTGVITPVGVDADALRKLMHQRFDLSFGTGLGKLKGRMFRIGHLGDCNDLTLMAALAGIEMGFKLGEMPIAASGVAAAMDYFAATPAS